MSKVKVTWAFVCMTCMLRGYSQAVINLEQGLTALLMFKYKSIRL